MHARKATKPANRCMNQTRTRKKSSIGCGHHDRRHIHCRKYGHPYVIKRILTPVMIRGVLHPVNVRQIKQPIDVRRILHSVRIRNISAPVTVSTILSPVTVDRINTPVSVSRIENPIAVEGIASPVVVDSVRQPISVSGINTPVVVESIAEAVSIRPLEHDTDNITVYGSNPSVPVKTDDLGRIVFSGQLQVSPVAYTGTSYTGLHSQDQLQSLPSQDVSIQTNLSYAIINRSPNQVAIYLEISPNDQDYTIDSQAVVPGLTTQAMTPLRFLRYAKISYRSYETGLPADFDVYYQAQSG